MKPLLDPDAVKKSICKALYMTGDCSASILRIKGFISNLPAGSLHVHSSSTCLRFYHFSDGRETYLSRKSDLLYKMCRKRYLAMLLRALELRNELCLPQSGSCRKISAVQHEFHSAIENLMLLLDNYTAGNLDITRIVLTSRQYKWFSAKYSKKNFSCDKDLSTEHGVDVRSKSERDIGNAYERFAVPYHYEEMIVLNVSSLVESFRGELAASGYPVSSICYEKNGACYWNVPPAFQWMNSNGSIWRAYKPNTGRIAVFNDFHAMLADGELFVHEHEGLLDSFAYRCNASERIYVMEISNTVKPQNLLKTSESDVAFIDEIITHRILPRLWF